MLRQIKFTRSVPQARCGTTRAVTWTRPAPCSWRTKKPIRQPCSARVDRERAEASQRAWRCVVQEAVVPRVRIAAGRARAELAFTRGHVRTAHRRLTTWRSAARSAVTQFRS